MEERTSKLINLHKSKIHPFCGRLAQNLGIMKASLKPSECILNRF